MKPVYKFPVFSSLCFVFLVFFGIPETIKLTSRVGEGLPGSDAIPVRSSGKTLMGLGYMTAANQYEGLQAAVPVTAPRAFSTERNFDEGSSASQSVGLPLVEKAPSLPYFAYSQGLLDLISQVADEQSQVLRGVYVENVLALPVVQQPEEDPLFVHTLLGTVTQFQSAAYAGVTGLLAHNYLSGKLFFDLEIDQEVNLVYGDGLVSRYLITDIQSYQKMAGDLNNSQYINLESGEKLTTPELFKRMYTGGDKVTFQTCIKKGSDWSWGRIFILAIPIPKK